MQAAFGEYNFESSCRCNIALIKYYFLNLDKTGERGINVT